MATVKVNASLRTQQPRYIKYHDLKRIQLSPSLTPKPMQVVNVTTAGGGLTRRNEILVGRTAMIGFVASLVGEVVTGKGIMGQLGVETHLESWEVQAAIAGLMAFNVVVALANPVDALANNPHEGSLQDPRVSLLDPVRFFGVSRVFGWTPKNELFNGRMAQIGFLASILTEMCTGEGPLTLYGPGLGVGLIALVAMMLFASASDSKYN